MEPPAPQDPETRTIIDKLAEFVARNGPDFEAVTKKKQLTNPKFGFLYGGEFYNYYKHRVCMEQRMLGQQQFQNSQGMHPGNGNLVNLMNPQIPQMFNMDMSNNGPGLDPINNGNRNSTSCPPPPIPQNLPLNMNPGGPTPSAPPPGNPNMLAMQIENLTGQQNNLREQIRQSEQNLQAQQASLIQQQQKTIDEMLPNSQKEYLQKAAKEENIDLAAFDLVLQPIIDSCTKDSISAGKTWILQYSTEEKKGKVVLQHLLQRALDASEKFSLKLHLIYLVNDVLHHCARKNVDALKNELENIVIPMFCSAQLIATEPETQKLTKLLSLWESKGNFFDACVISKLRSPESSMKEYNTNLEATHNSAVNALKQTTNTTFENYQKQHQAFVKHATQQIATWEAQKQNFEQQIAAINNLLQSPPPVFMQPPTNNLPPPPGLDQQQPPMSLMPPMGGGPANIPPNLNINMPPGMNSNPNMNMNNNNTHNLISNNNNNNLNMNNDPSYLPRGNNNNFFIPDLSRPPPGFATPGGGGGGPGGMPDIPLPPMMQQQQQQQPPQMEAPIESIPAAPYFDLPAGLMAPFIRLEDCSYKALDPEQITLPPPTPPSERLLMAVESFYALPCHARPRDTDGWEKLALYEYYKVKNQAKKQKEEAIQSGLRERSRSPSPVAVEVRVKKVNKRRYRSESRSPERGAEKKEATVMEVVKVVTPTRNVVEELEMGRGRSNNNLNSSGGANLLRGRGPSKDRRSDSPAAYEGSRGERQPRGRQREMSPTTPVIGFKQENNSIDESNKGHQMLLKMGWAGAGTGLGVAGQGIDKPIDGGSVRDRQDAYKGVGMNLNDPYENFRKNKGAAFITRMKARSDDK